MRVMIACIGRLKDGPERQLASRYTERFDAIGRGVALGPLTVREFAESRARSALQRMDDEAQRLLEAAAGTDREGAARIVVLDETGRSETSEAFAERLRALRDDGAGALSFLIGGADGHGAAVRKAATQTLSFGAMTLPHGLVRVVLMEQLYRASTIIAGHPYHRE